MSAVNHFVRAPVKIEHVTVLWLSNYVTFVLTKTFTVLPFFRQALRNFEKCIKPGGFLLIDHRNYDSIIDSGETASKSIYYNVSNQFV